MGAPQIWSPPGSCCYGGGDCGNSNSSKTQNKRWMMPSVTAGPNYELRVRLPASLSCTQEAPCTLQWTYMTGNSVDSYPEVFRNCADFQLGGETVAPTPAPPTTVAPTTSEPEPEPEPEPETSLPAPTPTPTQAATSVSTTAASTSPTTSTRSGEPC